MNLDISSNTREISRRLGQLAKRTPIAAKKGLTDATTVFFTGSRGRISSLIYNVPIPTVLRFRRLKDKETGGFRKAAKGKNNFFGFAHRATQKAVKAWRRTSTLLRGERADYSKLDQFETSIDNTTPYTKARHDLNRPSPVDGKTRAAPWRKLTVQQDRAEAMKAFRAALAANLNR